MKHSAEKKLGPVLKNRTFTLSNTDYMKIQSTLAKITDQVYNAKTAIEAKTTMIEHLKTTEVKDRDSMIKTVTSLNKLIKIQQYFTNCLLKYEGLSANQ